MESTTIAPESVERRLRFGLAAEQYERARPGYPIELAPAVLAYAGLRAGTRALEVGVGTGQATLPFARAGLAVTALDPSDEMVEIANGKFARAGVNAHGIVGDFESTRFPDRSFELVYAATSWHWLDPVRRFQIAADVMVPGGALAVFWTWPYWRDTPLRPRLDEAYARLGATAATMGPMLQQRPDHGALAREWVRELQESGRLGDPSGKLFNWSVTYSSQGYCDLLGTYGDHIKLETHARESLFGELAAIIDADGGEITVAYATLLLLARAG